MSSYHGMGKNTVPSAAGLLRFRATMYFSHECVTMFVHQSLASYHGQAADMYADKAVAALPIAAHVQTEACVICFNEVGERGPFVDMPCRHSMHRECLREWFRRSRTCPVCRASVSVPGVPTVTATAIATATAAATVAAIPVYITADMAQQLYMARRRQLIRQTNATLARYGVQPIVEATGVQQVPRLVAALWRLVGDPLNFADWL
jgi:hypothetical protein